MNFFNQLFNPQWKLLDEENKYKLFEYIKSEFISPELEISNVELKTFELSGVKNTTFEFNLLDESFVFIPGQKDVILGWESGSGALSFSEMVNIPTNNPELSSIENVDQYINKHTSSLRKVTIPPMIVGKHALPASCVYIGWINPLTGEFHGEVDKYLPFAEKINEELFPSLSLEDFLDFSQPKRVLQEGEYFLEYWEDEDIYIVCLHEEMTLEENILRIQKFNATLLSEDQWEYANGAGTRKIFRWGRNLLFDDDEFSQTATTNVRLAKSANMFGLYFDIDEKRYEITADPNVVKLGRLNEQGTRIEKMLPLSTYYQNKHSVDMNAKLSPLEYMYRKAIILKR
ncbi:MAG: hypothetical protein LBV67_03625 [Streptococcaceae bacterium]|nr:hypothetical protein [Streptococcaceae bacterium]